MAPIFGIDLPPLAMTSASQVTRPPLVSREKPSSSCSTRSTVVFSRRVTPAWRIAPVSMAMISLAELSQNSWPRVFS